MGSGMFVRVTMGAEWRLREYEGRASIERLCGIPVVV